MNKAVIFDMDGVLIDSEPAYLEMNLKMFGELGIAMDDENYSALVGMPSLPMWSMLIDKYKLTADVSVILQKERERMYEILDSDIITSPMKGVTDLLDVLKEKNYNLGVASSSASENIDLALSKVNIKNYFEFIISGEEVDNGKPAPDIFLKVSRHFNISPDKCFVIEDSTNGITAAVSAKMNCIGFTNNGSNKQNLSRADLIIENFEKENIDKIISFIQKAN